MRRRRARIWASSCLLAASLAGSALGVVRADETAPPSVETAPRPPAPDPSRGETYDGRVHKPTVGQGFLWVPRILLFPLRLLVWGLEPVTRVMVELEQRHHLYGHLYSASTSDDGQIGIRPVFSWTSSFRASGGVHLFHNRLFGPGTKATLDVSGGADVVDTAVHLRPTRLGSRVHVYIDTVYDRRNDWLFTGIGAHAPFQDGSQSRYQQDRFDQALRLDLRPTEVLSFTFGGYFGLRRFANGEAYSGDAPIAEAYCVRVNGVCVPGGVVDEALVPGFNQGTQFLRGSAGVHLDLRDDRVRPTLGAVLGGEADYSHGLGSDDSSYFRVRGVAGVLFNLWRHSHVLVLHGATEVVLPVGESIVPFSELAILGGPNDLRGFRRQAFRGYSSLFGTAEFRWPILPWVESIVFVDYGGVFDKRYQGIGASRMQPDVGFGFRVHSWDRFFVRMHFAYGFDGGWQIYLTGQNLP